MAAPERRVSIFLSLPASFDHRNTAALYTQPVGLGKPAYLQA
jgi:hypothetical protein